MKTIEQEIQAKDLTAPRITAEDIEAAIASECCFTAWHGVCGSSEAGELFGMTHGYDTPTQPAPARTDYEALRLLIFCVLVLKNGFTVTGESACVSPENFNAEIGRRIAKENAVNKMWPLMGYALRDRLSGS
jgi:hypothetical protein